MLVTLAPSMTYWLSSPDPPPIDGFARPALEELLTPGARYRASLTVRPTGTLFKSSLESVAPVVVDVALITSLPAVTLTASVTSPTSSFKDTSTGLPIDKTTSFCSAGANPFDSARTVYVPGVRNGTLNRPSASAVTDRAPCPPVIVTVAPGMASPCASTTWPV